MTDFYALLYGVQIHLKAANYRMAAKYMVKYYFLWKENKMTFHREY